MTTSLLDGGVMPPPPFTAVAAALRDAPLRFPGGEFLFFGPSGAPQSQSFAETLAAAEQIAAGLQRHGLRPGDGLIIALENGGEFVKALWAGLLIGATVAPLTAHLKRLKGTDSKARMIELVRDKLGGAMLISDDVDGALSLADLTDDAAPLRGEPASPRVAILTSGTSGTPKLAELSETALLARWWPNMPEAGAAKAFLTWSPFDHVMGLSLFAPNLPRKAHLEAEVFAANPRRWLDVVEFAGITHATMTNFGLSLLVEALQKDPVRPWKLDHLVRIGVGAEDISAPLCARFLDLLAPCGLRRDALILGYGLTECGPVVGGATPFSPTGEDMGAVSLDRPTLGHLVRIVGPEGEVLEQGETGLIEVTGPTLFTRYVGDAAATMAALTDDGWMRTGDLGHVGQGRLTVTGRAKDVILINAKKYTCLEVEAELSRRCGLDILTAPLAPHQALRGKAVAVFGIADDAGNPRKTQVISDIRKAVADLYHFAPEAVAVIARDEIPRTSLGKISRTELANRLDVPEWAGRFDRLTALQADDRLEDVQRTIADIWSQILKCGLSGPHADFYELGGDSLLTLQMTFALEKVFGVSVHYEDLPNPLTIAALARALGPFGAPPQDAADQLPAGVLQRLKTRLEDFPGTTPVQGGLIHLVGGADVPGLPLFWCLQNGGEALSYGKRIGVKRPAYAMRSGHLILDYATPSATALARAYADEITQIWPGPYALGGNCQGAIVALAIARLLLSEGRKVSLFAPTDTVFPDLFGTAPLAVPTVLISARRSKFNPARRFDFPEAGLRKWLPGGVQSHTVESDYGRIMHGASMVELSAVMEHALTWAEAQPECALPEHAVPRARYSAELAYFGPDQVIAAGARSRCEIALCNSGLWPWTPFAESGLTICHRWLDEDGKILAVEGGCLPLDGRVEPGELNAVDLDFTAPPIPGRYRLEVDLVEQGVCWFSDRYSPALQIPVEVRKPLKAWQKLSRSLGRNLPR